MVFFKIDREIYIDEIINNNQDKLICILFGSSNKDKEDQFIIRSLKKHIKHTLTPKYKDNIIFLYIDLNLQYHFVDHTYTKQLKVNCLPCILLYHNLIELDFIQNIKVKQLTDLLPAIVDQVIETNKVNNINSLEQLTQIKNNLINKKKKEEIEKKNHELLIEELEKMKRIKELKEKVTK